MVPVYNVEPYLRQCLDSVLSQSIGLDRLELIAVDDGSTDGSAELLDSYAGRHGQVRVLHEPNSGGPGRPRNVGLDHASGTYVFFLDADDYLGPEALERLVAMAERNGSDVVLGKMVGVAGRLPPTRAFRRTLNRASLADVYSTLAVMKLFRRALIEQVGVRFDENVAGGEDSPFTAEILLSARVVSVVADYDCYYCRNRPGSQSKRVKTEDLVDYLTRMSRRAELLARYRSPGRERDRLMTRHIWDLLRPFDRRWLSLTPDERRRVFDVGRVLLGEWHNERIQAMLAPPLALRAYCLQHDLLTALEDIVGAPSNSVFGQPILEGRRIFANYPHFRGEHGIPDSCFDLTRRAGLHRRIHRAELTGGRLQLSGEAYLSYLGGETRVVLKRWPWGREHRFATTKEPTPALRDRNASYPQAGFRADIDVRRGLDRNPLLPGPWQVRLAVGPPALRREAPVRLAHGVGSDLPTVFDLPRGSAIGAALYSAADGSLRLRVGAGASARMGVELAMAYGDRLRRRARHRLGPGVQRLRRRQLRGRRRPDREWRLSSGR